MFLALLRQHNTLEQLNANFTTLITNLLLLQISAGAEVESFAQNITNFYLGGNSYINISDPNSVQGFINASINVIVVKNYLKSKILVVF